jgi:regulator of nucleoside diphosphate kinase
MSVQTSTIERDPVITEADHDRLSHLVVRQQQQHRITLAAELGRGKVVPASDVPKDVVTMHSRVRVRRVGDSDGDGDGPETYTLVYPEEADFSAGKLSVLAPMGTALLGARAGQEVEFEAPAGTRRIKVLKVLYQPEAAGDFHL